MSAFSRFRSGLAGLSLANLVLSAGVFSGGAFLAATPAAACSSRSYVGTICTVAFDYCPKGTLAADGSLQTVSQENQGLYTLIGTTYGGDATRKEFNLPNLQARSIVGVGEDKATGAIVTQGQKFGQISYTLTEKQVPLVTHTHMATFTADTTKTWPLNIPANAGTLGVSGSLIAKKIGGTVVPDTGYFLGQGGIGTMAAPIYVASSTQADTASLGGLTVGLTGTQGNGAITANIPAVAGTVTVGNAAATAREPVRIQPPSLGLKYCIVVTGDFPQRP